MCSTEISVIIPAYNSAAFIEATLASVLSQTFRHFEIIVVDDGSRDNTQKIIRKWQEREKRIKYFYQENQGVAAARNVGIRKAKGTYITFLDSDDSFEPEFLEKMYAKIEETQSNLCFCGFIRHFLNQAQKCEPGNFYIPDPLSLIIDKQWISTDSWLIRKEFLQQHKISFTEGMQYGEDFEFFCRLIYLSEHSITYVKEYLSNYNYRPDSLTSRDILWHSLSYITGNLEAYKSTYDFISSHPRKAGGPYLVLLSKRIKKFYLRCLWGTLLLDTHENFNILYHNYQKDYIPYHLALKLKGTKYLLWQTIIHNRILRIIGKYIFRPYKYIQRKASLR